MKSNIHSGEQDTTKGENQNRVSNNHLLFIFVAICFFNEVLHDAQASFHNRAKS